MENNKQKKKVEAIKKNELILLYFLKLNVD